MGRFPAHTHLPHPHVIRHDAHVFPGKPQEVALDHNRLPQHACARRTAWVERKLHTGHLQGLGEVRERGEEEEEEEEERDVQRIRTKTQHNAAAQHNTHHAYTLSLNPPPIPIWGSLHPSPNKHEPHRKYTKHTIQHFSRT
jgi:hypothetical protein